MPPTGPPAPAQRAILVLPLPTLAHIAHPAHLTPALRAVSQLPLERLLIVLLSPCFRPAQQGGLHVRVHWGVLQRLLAVVYVEATREAVRRGEWERGVDVLLEGALGADVGRRVGEVGKWGALYCCEGVPLDLPDGSPLASIPQQLIPLPTLDPSLLSQPALPPPTPSPPSPSPTPTPSTHHTTALGGTFDHLHAGHKILLSSALLLTSHRLVVGLTAAPLLKNKRRAELVQGMEERVRGVREFCALFRDVDEEDVDGGGEEGGEEGERLRVDAVEISDVAGPTAWDASIEALVVSKETLPGADAIAKIRETNHLPPLKVYVIDVISSDDANLPGEDAEGLKEAKISSTAIREWLAQRAERAAAGETKAVDETVGSNAAET